VIAEFVLEAYMFVLKSLDSILHDVVDGLIGHDHSQHIEFLVAGSHSRHHPVAA
jgi:hypothetical protein